MRTRYDGEKRNPWDEPECGHHYARAMAAWSGLLAISGFEYHGPNAGVAMLPRSSHPNFRCFWSTATGWGMFSDSRQGKESRLSLQVEKGSLACSTCTIRSAGAKTFATLNGKPVSHRVRQDGGQAVFQFSEKLQLQEGDKLELGIRA